LETKPRREEEPYPQKFTESTALEASANRSVTLEILDDVMSFRDHTMSIDRTQHKIEEPDYATKNNTSPYNP
jgi:hypothetical protein